MERLRLGSRVLGAVVTRQELSARGIYAGEPEAEPLLRFARQLCTEEGWDAERLEEAVLHLWATQGALLCSLSPRRQECFCFPELSLALDALSRLQSLRHCTLWVTACGYVAEVRAEAGAVLAEFGEPLTDAAQTALRERGTVLATEQHLRRLLHPRGRGLW